MFVFQNYFLQHVYIKCHIKIIQWINSVIKILCFVGFVVSENTILRLQRTLRLTIVYIFNLVAHDSKIAISQKCESEQKLKYNFIIIIELPRVVFCIGFIKYLCVTRFFVTNFSININTCWFKLHRIKLKIRIYTV